MSYWDKHTTVHNEGGGIASLSLLDETCMWERGVSKNKEVKFLFSSRVIMDTCGRRTSTHNNGQEGILNEHKENEKC